MKRNFSLELQKAIYELIRSVEFLISGKSYPGAFTRKGKQSFCGIVLMILRGIKNGLTQGIRDAVEENRLLQESISNQAFSKQRMFIKPEAFKQLFEKSTEYYCENRNELTIPYRGYRLLAIDGTMYNLPNVEELEKEYGVQKSQGADQVQGRGSCLVDLTSLLILDTALCPCATNERELAAEHLNFLERNELTDSLVIMDRGYPSFQMISRFEDKQLHYLMRCDRRHFFKEVRDAKGDDCVITHKQAGKQIHLRVVRITLKSGQEETLLTNIFDAEFTREDFKELYARRWGIETNYDALKNTMQIEKFSGTSSIAVKQDFYATMLLKNMVQMEIWTHNDEINKRNRERDRKYDYKINVSAAVSAVRDDFIAIMIDPSPWRQKRRLKALSKKLMDKVIPIRPNRSFGDSSKPRKPLHHMCKYPVNRKQ